MIETELGRDALLARIDELLEARYRSVDLGNTVDTHVHRIFTVRRQHRGLCMGAPLGPLTPGFDRVPMCRGGGPAVTVRNLGEGAPQAAASLRRRVFVAAAELRPGRASRPRRA